VPLASLLHAQSALGQALQHRCRHSRPAIDHPQQRLVREADFDRLIRAPYFNAFSIKLRSRMPNASGSIAHTRWPR
jgi:hypothetical protein